MTDPPVSGGHPAEETQAPPGWYPDPGDPRGWRWWDGAQWTGHVSGPQAETAPAAPDGPGVDPETALAREAGAVRLARIAFIAQPFVTLGTAITWFVTRDEWRAYLDDVLEIARRGSGTATPPEVPSDLSWTQFTGLLGIAVTVMLVVWVARSIEAGRALGRRGPLAPWLAAVGFVIPGLNLWFPCQGLVQSLPPQDPARRRVLVWWFVHVLESLGTFGLFFVVLAEPGRAAALTMAIGLVALSATAAVLGERAADDVLAAHAHLASGSDYSSATHAAS